MFVCLCALNKNKFKNVVFLIEQFEDFSWTNQAGTCFQHQDELKIEFLFNIFYQKSIRSDKLIFVLLPDIFFWMGV